MSRYGMMISHGLISPGMRLFEVVLFGCFSHPLESETYLPCSEVYVYESACVSVCLSAYMHACVCIFICLRVCAHALCKYAIYKYFMYW